MIDGLVSIITPCYNAGRFIAETIESVLGQTWPDWEMIVVDDGSSDTSADIVADYARRDGRIRLIRQRLLNLGAQRTQLGLHRS